MTISRPTARRRARIAQGAAAVLILAAGALAALPATGLLAPPKPVEHTPTDGGANADTLDQPAGPGRPQVDITIAGSVIQNINEHVEPAPPPPPPEEVVVATDEPTEPEPEPPPPTTDWKYLGAVVAPNAVHALIAVGDKQELIAVGAEREGVRLVNVYRKHIIIDKGDGEQRVDLTPRSEEAAWAFGTQVVAPPISGAAPPAKGGGPKNPAAKPNVNMSDPAEVQRMAEEQKRAFDAAQRKGQNNNVGGGEAPTTNPGGGRRVPAIPGVIRPPSKGNGVPLSPEEIEKLKAAEEALDKKKGIESR